MDRTPDNFAALLLQAYALDATAHETLVSSSEEEQPAVTSSLSPPPTASNGDGAAVEEDLSGIDEDTVHGFKLLIDARRKYDIYELELETIKVFPVDPTCVPLTPLQISSQTPSFYLGRGLNFLHLGRAAGLKDQVLSKMLDMEQVSFFLSAFRRY